MLRRRGSTVVRSCDGHTQQTPFGEQPCRCPPTVMGGSAPAFVDSVG
jgi:hypothetical protein